jgi:hypothetical protein
MKALFWNRIPDAKIQSTVWEGIDDNHVRLDTGELEAMFAKVDNSKKKAAEDGKAAAGAKKVSRVYEEGDA